LVVTIVVYAFVVSRKMSLGKSQQKGLQFLLVAVLFQFFLGVFTLLYAVPVSLGLLHQLGAFVLLGATIFCLHRFSKTTADYAQTLSS